MTRVVFLWKVTLVKMKRKEGKILIKLTHVIFKILKHLYIYITK